MHLFLNPVTIYHISSRRERELPYSYRYHVIGSNLTTDQHVYKKDVNWYVKGLNLNFIIYKINRR